MSDVEEGNTHNASSTAFLEEDFSLSDQDDDESRVLAALENEEEDDIMVESDPVFDSDPISEGIDDTLLTQEMQGDMRQHLSPSKIDSWTKKVRAAFQVLFKDPAAKEKSPEQLNAIVMLMAAKKDAMITLKTGGGKSALWMIAPLIHPYPRCIVICPFVALLEEQVERCLSAGLRAHNFTKNKNVPDDVQLLFIQVESCSSKAFRDMMHAQENRYHRIFIDENHDSLICHPERKEPWKKLARHLSILRMPLNFLSGTNPPSNVAASLKIFGLKPKDVIQIRSCTDRPEIGFHVVKILPHAYDLSLKHIVFALLSTMTKSDRMLVFFNRNKEADEFSTSIGCAVFHSELPTLGNTKGLNLERWDTGETQVMACTTAFAQGVDRSSVRYVVISEVEYGLMVVNQMSGRAGRDGREAHTFYLTRKTTLSAFDSDQDYDCLKGLDDVLFGHTCRRYTSIRCMDGEQHAYRCKERSDVMQCDVCDPRSHMELFVAKAIRDPFRPTSDHPAESRETEEDFFAQLPDITPEMTRAIDTFEASDTTRSPSSKKALLRKDRAAKFLSSQPSSSSVGSTTASEHPASKKDRSHRSSYPTLSKTSTDSAPAASRSTESKQDRSIQVSQEYDPPYKITFYCISTTAIMGQ
ncbi:P-loop containing nucleoside triphosphate hydrolase protein [Suillus hirtellus]|nr:P-loop containing nucleoside triphosphate hydrolase protein [Suillus hirtellus]